MNKWTKKFPNKVGLYWFYGYRYGKSKGNLPDAKKEFYLVKVRKVINGFMAISEGQFFAESELEEALFCKTEYPKIPNHGKIYDK